MQCDACVCVVLCDVRVNRNPTTAAAAKKNQRELNVVCSVTHPICSSSSFLFMGPSFVLVFRTNILEKFIVFRFFFCSFSLHWHLVTCGLRPKYASVNYYTQVTRAMASCICARPPIRVNEVGIAFLLLVSLVFFFFLQPVGSRCPMEEVCAPR